VIRPGRIVSYALLIIALVIGVLFTVQNLERTSDLSLDLWLVAYHLAEPQPIPYLLWGALGVGLIIAGAAGVLMRMGVQRRVRELEQQVARANLSSTPDDDWT
jgi:hypothetical protein